MVNAASIPELVLSTARDPAIRRRQALWTAQCPLDYAELEDAIAKGVSMVSVSWTSWLAAGARGFLSKVENAQRT